MSKYYVTTPIYYVNGKPHLGHVYTTLIADVFARFNRLDGNEVFFITGTDEHGQKVAKSAEAQGKTPKQLCDEISNEFSVALKNMGFSFDFFMRTTEDFHKQAVTEIWKKFEEKGYIYLDKYSGWYAVRDECYYQESELVDGKAPSGADVVWLEEESYFFKLSAFEDLLLKYYESHPDFIKPEAARNEVIAFVKGGLKDLSVSRTTFDWGIKVPGNDKHVIYVWLDALFFYYTALKHSNNLEFWPPSLQIVGKDILRFHAIYWPAFLMAADLELPNTVFAHGWWLVEGDKMSKSIGNVLDPVTIAEKYGIDYIRYFLVREMQFGKDHNFIHHNFITRCNAELSNNIGNLVQRVTSFVHRFLNGIVPHATLNVEDNALLDSAHTCVDRMREFMKNQEINKAFEELVRLANLANEYIDRMAPWSLRSHNPERMNAVLYTLLEVIRVIGLILLAVIPTSANKILDILHVSGDQRNFAYTKEAIKYGAKLNPTEIIFARIE